MYKNKCTYTVYYYIDYIGTVRTKRMFDGWCLRPVLQFKAETSNDLLKFKVGVTYDVIMNPTIAS